MKRPPKPFGVGGRGDQRRHRVVVNDYVSR
jgi:hypothetical protein